MMRELRSYNEVVQELEILREKAKESEKLKSAFLSQMSHEIRTPLNILISCNSLIREEVESKVDDSIIPLFDSMQSAGKRIVRTIDQMVFMSMLHLNQFEAEPEKIELYSLIRQISEEYRIEAEGKGLYFNFEYSEKYCEIFADRFSITTIIQNLIDNAIKFTSEGSISIVVEDTDDKIILEVFDTGCGIDDTYKTRLFEPFSQEECGYSRRYEGNGLGLSVSKRLADINGFGLEIKSERRKGTTARLQIRKS